MGLPKCEHGLARDDPRFIGAWAAPFSECGCCGISFPYLDHAAITVEGSWGENWTKDRCAGCGGHYVAYDTRPEHLRAPRSMTAPPASSFSEWDAKHPPHP